MTSIAGSLKLDTKSAEVSKYVGFAIPAFAILVSLAIAFLIVWPKFQEVQKIKADSVQLKELSIKLEAKATKLSSLDAGKLTTQIGEAEQLLPSDKGVFEMLRQIESVAGGSGALISSLSVQPGVVGKAGTNPASSSVVPPPPPAKDNLDPSDASKISLRLSLTSDYRALLSFLTGLSSISRGNAVRDLSVTSTGAGSQLTSSFTVDAYWQAIPSELASIETPVVDITADQEAILAKVGSNNSGASFIPAVPLGRTDLFAPF